MTAGQILTFATTADWEAWRDTLTTSITASEAAAAMRLSPYCTARMLQLRKQAPRVGLDLSALGEDGVEAMLRGWGAAGEVG